MLTRILSNLLLALCGAGLLLAWMEDQFVWYIFEALVYGLLIVWTAGWVTGKLQAAWSWLFLPLLAVIAWGIVQLRMGWSVYAFSTEMDVLRWGTYLSVFFLAVQLFGEEESGRNFRTVFTVYSLLLAVVSVFQYFLGNGKIFWLFLADGQPRLGPFLNRDHYASFIALAIPVAAFEMGERPQQRWFFALALAVMYASAIAGGSRAGFVLLTLEVVLLLVMLRFSGKAALTVTTLIVAFCLVVGWDTLYKRLVEPDPYGGRLQITEAALHMVRASPWHGFGLGTWTQVYPAYSIKDFGTFIIRAAHNDWLQWGADGGIPMVCCLLAVFFGACLLLPRMPWVLGVPIVFLHGGIDFPMQLRFLPMIVFLVLGVSIRSSQRRGPNSGLVSTDAR